MGGATDGTLTNAFQALTQIGAATLWVLPVIARGAGVRLAFAGVSAGLHLWLSHAGWYEALHAWTLWSGTW